MNHHGGPTPIYKVWDHSLKEVDPYMNHRRGSTPSYKGCDDSLIGVDPSMNYYRGAHFNLQELR